MKRFYMILAVAEVLSPSKPNDNHSCKELRVSDEGLIDPGYCPFTHKLSGMILTSAAI